MSPLEALGWAGSALLIYSVMQARVLRFRLLNLVASLVLTAFNALLTPPVWPMAAMNLVLACINVWFLVRIYRERNDEAAYSVLQVGAEDTYLTHVLRVHADDIRRHQPDFHWDGVPGRDHAFLVLHGDETVGVVLIEGDGDVARVRLDYVTQRYRDFTVGRYVWRQSTMLSDLGFRRVVTPPGMVGAYYDRIGFAREGDVFTLALTPRPSGPAS